MKKLAEERRREKAEDRMARQRVKEQIAKDRAEREAVDSKVAPVNPAPMDRHPKDPATSNSKEYTTCRLQVYMLVKLRVICINISQCSLDCWMEHQQ